jgi:hypothetical protein
MWSCLISWSRKAKPSALQETIAAFLPLVKKVLDLPLTYTSIKESNKKAAYLAAFVYDSLS